MLGELAALGTAFCWSFGSIFFTSGGREIGALNVNRIRLVFGVILLGIALLIANGWLIQPGAPIKNVGYLALSGLIGLVIGDSFLFSAMVIIGPRLTLVIFSLSPAIAAITAWVFIGESLDVLSIVGMAVTFAGVVWVTVERPANDVNKVHNVSIKGVLFAFMGGACQAIGIVFAKVGMGEIIGPMAGTFIRMISSAVIIWIISFLTGSYVKTFRALKNRKGVALSFGGAFFGPFLGVTLSLLAVKNTEAGVAMAIMSIVPVLVIPWVMIFYREKVSIRAFVGAVVAVAGVFILFLH
jgi:drug/metabolite transporter (DMT)-like permease